MRLSDIHDPSLYPSSVMKLRQTALWHGIRPLAEPGQISAHARGRSLHHGRLERPKAAERIRVCPDVGRGS